MGKHWKILSMSILALVGVFAINAAAAQAKWVLLVGENKAATEVKVLGESKEEGYLLSDIGSKIKCTASTGSATAKLDATKTKLSGEATVTFTGCKEVAFEGTCTVHSTGQPNETIVAKGNAEAKMNGAEVYVETAAKTKFTTVEFLGEECPLSESAEEVVGQVKIVVLNPLSHVKLHEIHLEGFNLTQGNQNATLHMLSGGVPLKLLLGSLTEAGGNAFSVHLEELPGCATLC